MININNFELFKTRNIFFEYANKIDIKYRKGDDLKLYKELLKLRKNYRSFNDLIIDNNFFEKALNVLNRWNMNQQGAKLTSVKEFRDSIIYLCEELEKLNDYKLEELSHDDFCKIKPKIVYIFENLQVMDSKMKLVGNSKAMHFLFPDLIMPIDRKYILDFFYNNRAYNSNNEIKKFEEIIYAYLQITEKLELTKQDLENNQRSWHTSIPKLIDNAIICYFKEAEELVKPKEPINIKKYNFDNKDINQNFEIVWNKILKNEGEIFRTKTGIEFDYLILPGNIIQINIDSLYPIHKNEFKKAFYKWPVSGPYKIKEVRGPSYVFGILNDNKIL